MMKLRTMLVTAATAAMTLSTIAPSSAAPIAPARLQDQPATVQQVQYRNWDRGYGYGHRDRYYRHGYYGHRHHGNGAAVIGGLAAGAIIGGAIAAGQARSNNDAYCSQRFRTYDPASGTYIAKGGVRRSCP